MARDIYILVTKSNTYFSRFIHVMTDAPYIELPHLLHPLPGPDDLVAAMFLGVVEHGIGDLEVGGEGVLGPGDHGDAGMTSTAS